MKNSRSISTLLTGLALLLAMHALQAQTWPTRPLRFVVPLTHTTASESSVTATEMMVVSTGEPVAVRRRAFHTICRVRPAPPRATRRRRARRLNMRVIAADENAGERLFSPPSPATPWG